MAGWTKQQKLSTCPLVYWSAYRPKGSQMTFWIASMRDSSASMSCLDIEGLRFSCSRHSSVETRVLHSMQCRMSWEELEVCNDNALIMAE